MCKPQQFCYAKSRDANASRQGKETHPTHWPAAELCGFSRVRSGCARCAPADPRANPGVAKNARRVRGEDEL